MALGLPPVLHSRETGVRCYVQSAQTFVSSLSEQPNRVSAMRLDRHRYMMKMLAFSKRHYPAASSPSQSTKMPPLVFHPGRPSRAARPPPAPPPPPYLHHRPYPTPHHPFLVSVNPCGKRKSRLHKMKSKKLLTLILPSRVYTGHQIARLLGGER